MMILGERKVSRFNVMKKSLRDITATRLSLTLKEMEKHGMIKKQVLCESHIHIEYFLTKQGTDFFLLLKQYLKNYEK